MAPLAVNPAALDKAGSEVVTAGEGLGSVISTLIAALSGRSGMAGDDPAGIEVGHSCDSSAAKLVQAMLDTRNGLCWLGFGVRMSALNYSLAEAQSTISGHADPLPTPALPGPMSSVSLPPSVGTGVGAPAGWGWVAPYIGMIWPTADSGKLRTAATAWTAAGTQFGLAEILGTGAPMGAIRAQQIPEGPAIDHAFTVAYTSTTGIVQQCQQVAVQLTSYAAKVDKVHAAILDLLARICDPMTGIKEVWDFLTDEDEDEIKKIADDIRTVVDQFTSEVAALGRELSSIASEAETIVNTMGDYAAKQWDQFLHGTEVGRVIDLIGHFKKTSGARQAMPSSDSGVSPSSGCSSTQSVSRRIWRGWPRGPRRWSAWAPMVRHRSWIRGRHWARTSRTGSSGKPTRSVPPARACSTSPRWPCPAARSPSWAPRAAPPSMR
ncbi:hypothetical protein [Mycobacterium shigaense]|uniref:Outer membrane channel protein CpnT n=1 Tax=Mycobacterium shigaense TaxID=722731 RepID=A0A1Z4ED72_9MYCO|nr:hypothetical protein [Mycobacterium shigaense]PRI16927.1 hypothetical protein B2J96_00145 [Mycobacterium shigaense]BAX90888.1 outer membrane channel protein CpnT [Mycobacterium shigaense]